jgi:hypothetical protein
VLEERVKVEGNSVQQSIEKQKEELEENKD